MYTLRFLAYCKATGNKSVEATLEQDKNSYPGGLMTGYINWVSDKWHEFKALKNLPVSEPMTKKLNTEFDEWLKQSSTRR